jgi:hypothetical protein
MRLFASTTTHRKETTMTASKLPTTYHTDGTVTIWDVYRQQWTRTGAPEDRVLASLDPDDRASIERHTTETKSTQIGIRIGKAMARDVLAEDMPRKWAGLSAEDGDQLTAAGIVPGSQQWADAALAAFGAYDEAISAADDELADEHEDSRYDDDGEAAYGRDE